MDKLDQSELDFDSPEDKKKKKIEQRKADLQLAIRDFRLSTMEQKVAWLLNKYPATRNSDITLQIEYWSHFERGSVSDGWVKMRDLYHLPRLTSLTRARALIQNDYNLFLADAETRKQRGKLSEEEKEKQIEKKPKEYPCLLIYADESGKNSDYLIVGSVWFMTPFAALLLQQELSAFRVEQLDGAEIHFSRMNKKFKESYHKLIRLITEKQSLLGFKAIRVSKNGLSAGHDALKSLFHFLLTKGMEHEIKSNRAGLPRAIEFIKDAEEAGSDAILLADVEERFCNWAESNYKGKIEVDRFEAESSAENTLIQLADFFTGSLNRSINHKGQKNWKDEVASSFLRAVGMSEGFMEAKMGDAAIEIKL